MAKIEYEKKGQIAYLTLNRPEAMNAIDVEMIEIMGEIWDDFKSNESLRVAILSSSSKNFCPGIDIKSILERMGKEPYSWDKSSMFGNKNINPVEHGVQKPIIAALDGNVNGAGFFLALMADIRVATRETLFGLTEVRLNFPVEFTALLPRYLPVGVAMEMLITARRQSAERFYELGIINSLVERDALMTEAESYARDICAGSPMAISVMKDLMRRSYDHDYNGMMKLSASMVTPVVNSQDTTEALQAFLQKRKPVWKGK